MFVYTYITSESVSKLLTFFGKSRLILVTWLIVHLLDRTQPELSKNVKTWRTERTADVETIQKNKK